jgi:mannitol operon transcriptional antiterminator
MELNQRCIEILQVLRESDDFIRTTDLADTYGLTDRAIRYSIDKIEKFLVKNGFDYLEREHNKGIKLRRREGLEEFIDSFIGSHTPYKYYFSAEERFIYLAIRLLLAESPVSSEELRRRLYISKNTVLKSLSTVEEWLRKRNLILVKKRKVGIWVKGKEMDRRRVAVDLILQTLTVKDLLNYLDKQTVQSKLINLLIEELFGQADLWFLDELICQAEAELGRKFSDKAYCQLVIYLAIILRRAAHGIDSLDLHVDNMKNSIEFSAAKQMVERLQQELGVRIAPSETDHIMLYLLGADVIKSERSKMSLYQRQIRARQDRLYQVAATMTAEMEKLCGMGFGKEKRRIVEDLTLYLRSAVYRVKYGIAHVNPAYDEVRNKYNEMFQRTKQAARALEEYIKEKVDNHELSFLTMHFVAGMERAKQITHDKTRIIVVCGTGIGTASVLAYRLMNEFNVKIVDTVSCRGLSAVPKDKYDLIISTVDLPGYEQNRYLKVQPFLGEEDYRRLQQRLNRRFPSWHRLELSLVNRLIGVVEKYAEITDRQQLQYEMMYEIKRHNERRVERRFVYMLNDLLTRETIKLNLSCADWKEAIAAGAALLEEKKWVSTGYKEAIINNFAEFGPYMVVAPGIVLAHARPECGVKKLAMSLVTLEKPVNFGHELNDPVKLVVTFAATDNETHLKALSQLMEVFMSQEDLNIILNATNKDEVIEVVKKHSK